MTSPVLIEIVGNALRARGRGVVVLSLVLFSASWFAHAQSAQAAGVQAEGAHDVAGSCVPSFPFKDGWWGADAAYSIPLGGGRSVWIFGDTLYGDRRTVTGNDPRMVRNSIGVSRCDDQRRWSLQYVIRHGEDDKPLDFFQAQVLRPHGGAWYWALDGFVNEDGFGHEKDLWVTLLCVRNTRVKRADGFDFETCGTDLAKVSGLNADPQKWKVAYFPLVADGSAAYPSATAVVDGEYAYLFALYERAARPMLLTRVPLAGLDAPARNLQYLAKSAKRADEWQPGFKPKNAVHVMDPGTSEMTVRYHPDLKKWLAVMRAPDISSDAIVLRTAPAITGPWSASELIYRIPEMQKNLPGYDKNVFCYAGKEHPEFERPGSLVITYVCNTTKVPELVTNLKIYVPKVVEVPLPADVAGK
jgi:hypothetical protein